MSGGKSSIKRRSLHNGSCTCRLSDTLPEHKVQLSAFEISRFETTISDYLKFNPKPFPDHPILFNQFLKNDPCLPMHMSPGNRRKNTVFQIMVVFLQKLSGSMRRCWSNQGSLKEFLASERKLPEIYENPILMNVDDEVGKFL